jgi:triacylglycerol lipase
MDFDADFARDVLLPLAVHAYTIAGLARPCESLKDKGLEIHPIQVDPDKCKEVWAQLERAGSEAASDMLAAVMADSHVFGFVATGKFIQGVERETFICFRGTHFLEEWIKDADLPMMDYRFRPSSGRAHIGFQAVYETIRDSVLKSLEKAGKLPLTIVGHSLGGALATICALDTAISDFAIAPPQIFPIASPRVGDGEFRNEFDVQLPNCIRIVNKPDIVPNVPLPLPRLPPPFPQLDYRHVGVAAVVDGGRLLEPGFSHGLCEGYSRGLNSTVALPRTVLHKFD